MALCWCIFNDNLYFGSDDGIYQFDNSNTDDGVTIEGVVEQAYADFGVSNIKGYLL